MSSYDWSVRIQGTHYPSDMAVRMRKVLFRPWVSWCPSVSLALIVVLKNAKVCRVMIGP